MNKLILALAALLLAVGCDFSDPNEYARFEPSLVTAPDYSGYPPGLVFPATLQISSKFTDVERASIQEAVAAWNERTNGFVRVDTFVGDDPAYPCKAELVDEIAGTGLAQAYGAPQLFNCDLQLVRSRLKAERDRYDNDYGTLIKQVSIHELGHAFGLDHLPDEHAIMYSKYSPENLVIDEGSLGSFCELRGCPNGVSL